MLQELKILKTNAHWTSYGKEAKIDGHLFDVKKFTFSGDSLVLYGIYDESEDLLNAMLDEMIGRRQENDQQTKNIQLYLFFTLGLSPNSNLEAYHQIIISRLNFAISASQYHISFHPELPTPPPKAELS